MKVKRYFCIVMLDQASSLFENVIKFKILKSSLLGSSFLFSDH